MIVVGAVAVVSVLHFVAGRTTGSEHLLHVLLRLAYFLPLLLSVLWFGVKGGAWAAAACCLLLVAHMLISWGGEPRENVNQLAMIALFPLVGVGGGLLVDSERAERERRLFEEQRAERRTVIQCISSLAVALRAKDSYTRRHSEDVAALAVEVGRELGLSADVLDTVHLAGLVHDVGKIGLQDDILLKPERLGSDEFEEVKKHPSVAAEILRPIRGGEKIAELVLCHHEHLDGSGYPRGLQGNKIPMEARVLSVADVYSALTDKRTYKRKLSAREALDKLRSMSTTKLDPDVIVALEQVVNRRNAGERLSSRQEHEPRVGETR